ncbi:F0F1 ATP synthase subunit B [Acidisoma cellulosilytica]|uniref:ATP synthase subunit b n=1 Tax=Acidisoma cellulosilyticum TaxID=2802395 RepID=A0A964E3H1_9PROT|nr:F0F1 ATP synthase subunit B [Acidisoma cellulosilyticum]MCB8880364.1 F0F1 ATP synthase subunit B [Acidisoma cellulosilyticum]
MSRLFTTASLTSGVALGLLAQAGAAHASSNMPQMDFSNPLNGSQVVWLVIILVVLYLILSRWALPGVGAVLATRSQRIQRDLDAAHAAKVEADAAVAELHAAIKSARDEANAEVARATEAAKAAAAEQAAALSARLDVQLEKAEAEIAAARHQALTAIRPIARETAALLMTRLTGQALDEAQLNQGIHDALAARGLA